ncbi:MAG TPA: head decoration protein [Hyphomicrobiaceae bacterium]|nr:head decoration protein [Hyphomicrobiaceae bacterium]
MATLTEGRVTAAYILSESAGMRSRDHAKIASGAGKLEPGAILGKVTASGKYVPHAPAAADGSQTAVAILYSAVDATAADAAAVITARDAEVKGAELIYNAATDTQPEKDAVHATLAANGIIVR